MIARNAHWTIAGLTVAALVMGSEATAEPTMLTLNSETTVAGVQVGCTGIGQSRNDPKWRGFPVRVDFAKPTGHFLADVEVTLSRADGTAMLDVGCPGSQVLFRLPPGNYRVEGRLTKAPDAKPQTGTVSVPASGNVHVLRQGQTVVTLRFPGV